MGMQFEMRTMIDQALGHPEQGVVNFNVLHRLLHEILNHLGNEKEEEASKIGTGVSRNEAAKNEDVGSEETTDQKRSERASDVVQGEKNEGSFNPPLSSSAPRSHGVEERLHSLESRFETLNNLSIDKSIIVDPQQTDGKNPEANSQNALAIMWKLMSMHRRVQATEEAVEKVMGILNGVLRDISQLKDLRSELEKFRNEHLKMQGELDIAKSGILHTDSETDPEFTKQFNVQGTFASKKDLMQFVTWSALEEALNKKECAVGLDGEMVDGGKLEDHAIDRPGTAPISSSTVWEKVDDVVPPKTATSASQFTKLTGVGSNVEQANEGNPEMSPDTPKAATKDGSLSSKENSFGEVSLNSLDRKGKELSREDSKGSFRPSPQLITRLSRLGELPKQHDDVAVQVSTMSELQSKLANEVHKVEVDILPQKVDKEDLQLPDNLIEQFEMLKQGLDLLNTNQDLKMLATIKETTISNKESIENIKRELGLFSQHMKRLDQPRVNSPESFAPGYDQGVLNTVRDQLTVIQEEQEKMALKNKEDFEGIQENLDQKQHLIDGLVQSIERLQEAKADRENVASAMDVKADKDALEGKVNQSMFDETFEMFDRGLQEALQKMEDYMNEEMSLKDTLSRISQEMEGKIDSDSLQLMKDYFENQIKDVQESRVKIARETRVDATNAAGVRRKLPIHYHCISCNRPVEVTIKDSEPALPGIEGLPLRRLKFPLTAYDVEQVRQKSTKASYSVDDNASICDLLSGRPCGGSHTVINSQLRRSTKLHQFGQTLAARDDPRQFPKMTREVSVLDFLRGSDGNYYKGRSRQLLPSLPKRTVPCADGVEQNSVKGTQLSPLQTPPSMNADQKSGSHSTQRTPSPPLRDKCVDDLSSSYPQRSLNHNKMSLVHHYSSDDLNIPSTTSLSNGESIKVLQSRRGRTQEKDMRRQRCWDNHQSNEKLNTQDKSHNSDNEPTSPKSIKRTTPVGQEGPHTVSRESSYQEHMGQQGTADEINNVHDDKDIKSEKNEQ